MEKKCVTCQMYRKKILCLIRLTLAVATTVEGLAGSYSNNKQNHNLEFLSV